MTIESKLITHGSVVLVLTVVGVTGINLLNEPSWASVSLGAGLLVGSIYAAIKYIRWNLKRRIQE